MTMSLPTVKPFLRGLTFPFLLLPFAISTSLFSLTLTGTTSTLRRLRASITGRIAPFTSSTAALNLHLDFARAFERGLSSPNAASTSPAATGGTAMTFDLYTRLFRTFLLSYTCFLFTDAFSGYRILIRTARKTAMLRPVTVH